MISETDERDYMQNRELSWLKFNERVLSEAIDKTTPLLERYKFIAIFNSNLDEFYMIRVGSLFDLMEVDNTTTDRRTGWTPLEQITEIYKATHSLYEKRDFIYANLHERMCAEGIHSLSVSDLVETEKKLVKKYFINNIQPILSPQIINSHHPFPHLENNTVYVVATLEAKDRKTFAVIPINNALTKLYYLPGDEIRYIRIHDIILHYIDLVFDSYKVIEKSKIRVTRNADINLDDENFDVDKDFRAHMKQALKKRKKLAPVRLETSSKLSDYMAKYLCDKLGLHMGQVFVTSTPLDITEAFSLPSKLTSEQKDKFLYKPFSPKMPPEVSTQESMTAQVKRQDVLLSYPFESMEPFLQLLKEAADDPKVASIKITIYRLASQAKLVEHLCRAAENGKEVLALIELRARFDEQNNIDWSEQLEAAGCTIIYGFDGYKVHSKICLITRQERDGVSYITQVATGNYNEKTAKMYTDISLMTASHDIGSDANTFFKNMAIGNLEGTYEHLLVAPCSLKPTVIRMIHKEREKGKDGFIFIKINSLTDIEIMTALKEASCAGVKIQLVVRGICCLRPGVSELTENIKITNIVGRFLEHSRIYLFGKGEEEKIYLSSADFMTRNTEKRVEVACPIVDKVTRTKVWRIIDLCTGDNVKSRTLMSNGDYIQLDRNAEPLDSQDYLINNDISEAPPPVKQTFGSKLKTFFSFGRK